MTLSWALVGVALLLVPGRPAETPGRRRAPVGPPGVGRPVLAVVAAAAVGAAGVALAGPVLGGGGALVLAPLVVVALRADRARPRREGIDGALPMYLDLVAAALRAGRPPAEALAVALPAAPSSAAALGRVAGLLRLGADPEQAWSAVPRDGPLGAVRATAVRSASSGLRLAAGFEGLADDVRAELGAAAAVRAQRAGVLSMAPLGLCFLPSFVCLGVIPVVVGIARTALGVMP